MPAPLHPHIQGSLVMYCSYRAVACLQEVAVGKMPLKNRRFINEPGYTETLHVSLLKPEAHQQLVQYAKVQPCHLGL